MIDIGSIVAGAASGVAFSLSGWSKSPGESFNWQKFSTTLGTGIVVGVISGVSNIPVSNAVNYAATFGVTPIVKNIVHALWIWGNKRAAIAQSKLTPKPPATPPATGA